VYTVVSFNTMKRNKHRKLLLLSQASLLVLLLAVFILPLSALTRGYNTKDTELKPGMIAMFSSASTNEDPQVERATPEGADKIIGVATTAEASVATIASSSQSVYVETSGEVEAYVSDIQGEVHRGDLLTISPLRGIAAKADSAAAAIIGLALEDMTSLKGLETHTIKTDKGDKLTKVGLIHISLDSRGKTTGQLTGGDSYLQKLGKAVTGKNVSEFRVVIALIVFFLVLVAEGSILYGAISSGLLSIGRNPLAKKVILRELVRVVFVALFVLTFGLAAVYAILSV
jgi:hypothetical protein